MRTEVEMLELILAIAMDNKKIRLVEMNGSRADPCAKRDPLQDFDIVYYVEDIESFLKDHSWVDYFGERIMMQLPDDMTIPPADKTRESFSYLMLFTDGNRIDLTLTPVTVAEKALERKEVRIILLDKDNRLDTVSFKNEVPPLITKPNKKEFHDCSNEFWWVSTYIAKAVWRKELPLAKSCMEGPVRNMLMLMMNWHIGFQTSFNVNTGKGGKNIEKYIDEELWRKLVLTYPDGNYENIWAALFAMCDLFEELSRDIAHELHCDVPNYGRKIRPYLEQLKNLPADSK